MKTCNIIFILVFLATFFSCFPSNEKQKTEFQNDLWVNADLDFIRFEKDSIELGWGFGWYSEKFRFAENKDTVKFIGNPLICPGRDSCEFSLFIKNISRDTIFIFPASKGARGYFGKENSKFYVRGERFFFKQNWDSLVFRKLAVVFDGEILMEQIQLYPSGKVILDTKLVDSLKGSTWQSFVDKKIWKGIDEEIEKIQTPYFKLYDGEVADAFINEIGLFRGDKMEKYRGYDILLLFYNFRGFINVGIRKLNYKEIE